MNSLLELIKIMVSPDNAEIPNSWRALVSGRDYITLMPSVQYLMCFKALKINSFRHVEYKTTTGQLALHINFNPRSPWEVVKT